MEYSKVELRETTVTIGLPEWIDDDKFTQKSVFYNPKGHAYAGSYDHSTEKNMLVDELLATVRGAKSVMSHPMNCYIEVELDEHTTICEIIDEINEVLDMFQDEEYVKEVTETVYYNKP